MLPSIFGENLFDEFLGNAFDDYMKDTQRALYGKHSKNLMKTDVKETDESYEVDIDLPGFQKDEVSLDLKNGYLTVSAAKGLDKDEEDKKGRYIRQERYAGSCSRSFYVGDIRPEDIKAKYEAGVLRLSVPKENTRKLPENSRILIE